MQLIVRNIYALLSIILFLLIAPVCLVTLLICYIYRQLVRIILKLKLKQRFIDLMDGRDSIWAIEDETARSNINILSIIEVPKSVTSAELYDKLKTRIYARVFAPPIPYPKLFYLRKYSMGYFYWEQPQNYKLEDFVRSVSVPGKNQSYITKHELESYMGTIANSRLHNNHCATWKILIVNQSLEHSNKTVQHYPIIIRVHHSLCDGYPLLKLILRMMTDKNIEIVRPVDLKKNRRMLSLTNIIQCMYIPSLIFSVLFRKSDKNALHGSELSGEKILTWVSSDDKQKLFHKIRKIKQKIPDTRFNDIIASAISFGIGEYFKKNGYEIPTSITNVIAAAGEIRNENEYNKLDNRFTAGLLTIPLCPNSNSISRLRHVQYYTNELWNSLQFSVNYWIIKVLPTILPATIVRILIHNKHSTCGISNFPGPQKICLFDDIIVNDSMVWIPNRETTGVGFSIFTYDNHLKLGIICDKKLIMNSEHAQSILQDMVKEIENLATVTDVMASNDYFK